MYSETNTATRFRSPTKCPPRTSSSETTIRVTDAYGNQVVKAKVLLEVTQGGGKVTNRMAMFCRDNAGSAAAKDCVLDEDRFQSVEVPTVLDTKNRFGIHWCGECTMNEYGAGEIICPTWWTPDDQCDEMNWWTDSYGKAHVNWIMGPEPGGAGGRRSWSVCPGPQDPPPILRRRPFASHRRLRQGR